MTSGTQAIVVAAFAGLALVTWAVPGRAASLNGGSSADAVHRVRSGETLTGIARQYSVTVGSLVEANRLQDSRARLKPGAELAIPANVRRAARRAPATRSRPPARVAVAHRTVARRAVVSASAVTRGKPASTPKVRRAAFTVTVPSNLALTVPDFAAIAPAFQWPIDGRISSAFGRRHRGWHRGLDVVAAPGAAILASAAGQVIASDVEELYGRVVKIAHDNGFVTVYAHNERNLVDVGEWVVPGQQVATVGRTGDATSEHVHFEIRHDGVAYNPVYLLPLPPRVSPIEPKVPADDELSEDE